ncbi:MAG: aldehyde dehydrogenase family protein [Proteobacteria bacterium]|nr:MAG: aldehyde dehydrogenase family protein [Pseudomonadota bacterium]
MVKTDQFYINGQWVKPQQAAADFEVINPATEQVVASLAMGGEADANAAVAAANAAFDSYSQSSVETRIALLEKLLVAYDRRYNEMAEMMTLEMGAPVDYSRAVQTEAGRGHIEQIIKVLKTFTFEERMEDDCTLMREPVGVCSLITPWNWPINQVVIKVAPALAAGCTMVLKPSELSPLSALLFAEMVDEAGYPAGVFNLVNGDGPSVGAPLSTHPDVDCVSFTGSTRAGVLIAAAAAPTVKRVSQELGGKSPNIILPDANLKTAVEGGVDFCFGNAGQSCDAPTRMLVQRDQYDEAVEIARQFAMNVSVGDPLEHGDHMGPVISETQFNKIQGLIQAGIDEGARLVAGGVGKPEGFETGYYVKPTVFADVNNQMTIAREEIFGPVLAMIPYDTVDEAIAIANDTVYGLAACVSGTDKQQLTYVIRRLRAGSISVNGHYQGYASPFGGYKQSGNGREGGIFGLEEFLEVKTVAWI